MIQPRNHTEDKRNLNWRVFLLPSLDEWVAEKFVTSFVIKLRRGVEGGRQICQCVWQSLASPRWAISEIFYFLIEFSIFYQFITRFWSGPWALCFGRIHQSSICWPVPMTFLYYIVIRLVIFNFFHHLWLLLSTFSTFVLRRSSIQREICRSGSVFGRGYKLKYRIGVQQWSFDSGTLWNWLIFHLIWVLCECLIYYSARVEWLRCLEAKQYRT